MSGIYVLRNRNGQYALPCQESRAYTPDINEAWGLLRKQASKARQKGETIITLKRAVRK